MRKILCVSVLVLALCGTAFAGDIPSPPLAPGDIPNPPSAPHSSSNQANDGWIGTDATAPTADGIIHGDKTDSLTVAVLNVLASVLPLL